MKYTLYILGILLLFSCAGKKDTTAVIETDFGNIRVKLFESTPLHRDNFIKLVNEGFYDGLIFHRVIPNFMIQGGDPDSREAAQGQVLGQGGPGYTIPAEIGALHYKGALAAARLPDQINPNKESSGSQFFIVQGVPQDEATLAQMESQKGITYTAEQKESYKQKGGYPFLDGDYTVFGEVIEGLDVIDKIAVVPSGRNNRPVDDVKMTIRME